MFLKIAGTPEEETALATERRASTEARDPAFRRALGAAPHMLALERVDGIALGAWWPTASDGERHRATCQLLRALASLHEAGLAHGDLKPDHVILEASSGDVRLIDLGLCTPLGEPARGGTHGYLAPELLRGEPVSPASDLYALGRMWLELGAGPLDALARACASEDPSARPASARAALHALGVVRPGSTWLDRWPAEVIAALGEGGVVAIDLPPGGGRSTLARRVLDEALRAGRTAVLIEGRAGVLRALADVCEIDGRLAPDVRIARALLHLLDPARPVVIDGTEALDADDREALRAALLAVSASAARGTLLLLGPNDRWAEIGVALVQVAPADALDAAAVLGAHGAPDHPGAAARAIAITGGRRGALGRLARRWAEVPEASADDVWAEVSARAHRDLANEPDVDAGTWLARGAPRRALMALGDEQPDEPIAITTLRARAELLAGALEAAARHFAMVTAVDPSPALGIEHAQLLERLGRHREAAAACDRIRERAGDAIDSDGERFDVLALRIAAQCALATGDPRRAAELATSARGDAQTPVMRARLDCIESDAALRLGDGARALEIAERAQRIAAGTGDPTARAHAAARVAAAHALSGARGEARSAWHAALAFAEASGEVAALPPYVMNLATADHAAFRVSDAIAGYERAATLAARLGRTASEIAALTNLGGLLAAVRADREALAVLDRAEARSGPTRSIAPLYLTQGDLLRAEIVGRTDPARGRALAAQTAERFAALGAARQALECRLIGCELEVRLGQGEGLDALIAREHEALRSAGLLGRALVAQRRAALAAGALERALRDLPETIARAEADDPDLHVQALIVAVEAHRRAGTGAADGLSIEARRALGVLAANVPPGLREAYLRAPERQVPATIERVARAERGLDEAGRRLLSLVSRISLATDDDRILEAALDEAVALTRAERAFLLMRRAGKRPEVARARNLDRESVQRSRFRFSRSVAERVLESGEPLITASATEDPALAGSRSVLDLGLRSILVVPVRDRTGVIAALYVDHRFETGRFGDGDLELAQALADVIGLALENARLHREASLRAEQLAQLSESLREQALEREAELARLNSVLARPDAAPTAVGGIVGRAPAIRAALELAGKLAQSDIGVAIQGASGTGKELLARYLHDQSPRRSGPWLALNCGALPAAILESELFGHVRGAFTGAIRDHVGVFRAASGGTVFLDEIAELPLPAQARLLRVLEAREVLPVGATKASPIDVRVVCATHRDLSGEVEAGRFRRDLYFRLVGATLTLPPLRERREDLPLLVTSLLAKIATEPGMRSIEVSAGAMRALAAHDWPGNVRELLQTLRRAALVAEGAAITEADLGLPAPQIGTRQDARRDLDRAMIEQALRAAHGNRTHAAAALGITRMTLHRAMKRLDLPFEVPRGRPRAR